MNIKTIVVGSLAVTLAIGGYLLKVASEDVETTYTPRNIDSGIYGHAGHAEYLRLLRADPATGEVNYDLIEQVKTEIAAINKKNNKALLGMTWQQMGPDNVGGRTRAVLVDKNNSSIIYAGSVAGGLFVSTDGANTWNPVTGHQGILGENLIISCITQTDNGRIFFGTGSTFEGSTGPFKGNGVYEYVPSSGMVLPVLNNAVTTPPTSNGSLAYINAIAAKGNRLYLGTAGGFVWADPDGSGDYPTTFSAWTNPLEQLAGLPETSTCQDIDLATDGSMLICFSGKIYTSNGSDAFGAFTKQSVSGGRISGAIAPSNPNVFYRVRTAGILISIDISLDKGNTWDVIIPGGGTGCHDPFRQNDCGNSGQGGYDDAIAVNPSDWGHIIVGGVQLFEWKHNPGSNPIGGSWLKSANLFESTTNPYYVHADKHTIIWPTANTVYIGSDGGIFKSTNSGETWQEKNLGYNVTTFYDMQVAANGWFVGGAQDNGSQLFTYGGFGVSSPKGTIEVTSGDGFDCAFSNQGPGVIYTTSQSGSLSRTIPGGTPGAFFNAELSTLVGSGQPFHTVIQNWESNNDPLSKDSINLIFDSSGVAISPANANDSNRVYPGDTIKSGDVVYYSSLSNGTQLQYTHSGANYIINTPKDSMMLQDYIQNKFVFRTSSGIYFTKDAARLNDISTDWYKISNSSNIENMEFSPDGNSLFMGTSSGQVYRIDGLSQAGNENDTMYDIRSGTTVITGPVQISGVSGGVANMASDPNNGNNLIITTASYTTGNHIFRSTDALSGSPSATAIQGVTSALPKMPIYDADIDYVDNDKVVLGTDWGVWTSDNAFSASAALVEWTDESDIGMAHCPVYAVEQQQLSQFESVNSGVFYLGTYGRGFYLSEDLANSINDDNNDFLTENNKFISDLEVYPNPMNISGTVEFTLAERSNAIIKIFNLSGSLVKTINLTSKSKGANKEKINVSELSIGSYIMTLEAGANKSVAKFIVTR